MNSEELCIGTVAKTVTDELLVVTPEAMMARADREAAAEAIKDRGVLSDYGFDPKCDLVWPAAINAGL